MKGRKVLVRKSNRKRRAYGFRSRSKTAGGRRIIRRKRRRHGRFVAP
ncbi:MAG TPA: 50S ribosomal protein L34 [Planctomycetes bacterium]|nr:50S ribosomal protein L34 [Planctomycetota bacterium]